MKAVVTLSLALLFAACTNRTPIDVDGFTVYEAIWQKVVAELGTRAASELACPADKLSFTLLSMQQRHPTQVAVEGCDKQVTFEREVSQYAEAPGPWQVHTSPDAARGNMAPPSAD